MGYRALLHQHKGLLSIAFLAMFTSSPGQSFFVGLFQIPIAEMLELSIGQFGIAYAFVTLIAGFAMLSFGPCIDWIPPRRFALVVLIILLNGVLLLTFSPWWGIGLLGLGLVRLCGQGLMTHLGNTLAGREFEGGRGKALALVGVGTMLGGAILPTLVAVLLVWLDWRELWWLFCLLLAGLWVPILLYGAWPPAPGRRPSRSRRQQGPHPFREKDFWQLLPMLMVLPVTMTGVFIYQARMTEDLGSSLAVYALALAAMGVANLFSALVGGHWIDQLGPARVARLYLLPYALALLIAIFIGGDIGVWALMIGGGLGVGAQEPIATSLLARLWGTEHLGRLRAALSACMVFATGIAPAVLGVVLDLGISFIDVLIGMLVLLGGSWAVAQSVLVSSRAQDHEPIHVGGS
ncbi:MFS transporter [Halomonas huangheensis]|uniref:Major facilitator superfamily (MFS) profile domain-containing protein n=1 Tax=Halomonas huangheensis TaxID=1178482 RepID=W1NB37_9GAMM|nr:MFS transporter [Halomonas huangheensis]ALM52698.1 MFS transporter [Halomonas huangheensis]ERL52772.1 hypothetical protein BJB45_15950 [Halomonas huangheensis]